MSRIPLKTRLRSSLAVALVGVTLYAGCSWGETPSFRPSGGQESPTTRVQPDSDSLAIAGGETLTEAELNPRLPGKEAGEDPGSLYYLADPGDDAFAMAGFGTSSALRAPDEGGPTREPPSISTPDESGPDLEVRPDPLVEARERKSRAFERYTRLVTTGGEGDVREALREYREATARLKELEGRR